MRGLQFYTHTPIESLNLAYGIRKKMVNKLLFLFNLKFYFLNFSLKIKDKRDKFKYTKTDLG